MYFVFTLLTLIMKGFCIGLFIEVTITILFMQVAIK